MLENFIEIDRSLFHFIHETLSNPVLDVLLPPIRAKLAWLPLYALVVFACFKYFGKKGIIYLFGIIATLLLADQISATLIKPWVGRLRPCQVGDAVNLLVHCGSGKSFVSSHATNHFALGVFWAFLFSKPTGRNLFPICLLWAASISFAQIYVGVHYPLDILGGTILGCLIGYAVFKITDALFQKIGEELTI